MITREQYLEALELVDNYHRQTDKQQTEAEVVESQIETEVEKTTIDEWIENSFGSTRLLNALNRIQWDKEDKETEIEYIEDIQKKDFMKIYYVGKKTWDEFCELRKIETKKQ